MVNTTSSSFPFLEKLSRTNRVLITATETAAQRYETVFPEYFIKAFSDPSADLDKNGRVSLWESFAYASAGVHHYYEERGQLATERALLDDNGDKTGKDAESPGPDGALASTTYFEAELQSANGDAELADLLRRRDQFVGEVEVLKAKKASTPKEQYDAELEKLLVDLAMLSRQIRAKGVS